MKKMAVSHVLISGIKGLGAEIAKNVILVRDQVLFRIFCLSLSREIHD